MWLEGMREREASIYLSNSIHRSISLVLELKAWVMVRLSRGRGGGFFERKDGDGDPGGDEFRDGWVAGCGVVGSE